MATISQKTKTSWLDTKRGRVLIENLTAYAFLAPAGLIIFTFGIFPVAFAFFVSLHRWRRFPEEFRGLDNYVEAMGSFAFVLFFWMAIGILIFGIWRLGKLIQVARAESDTRRIAYAVPGFAFAAFIVSAIYWFFTLLPFILNIPRRLNALDIRVTRAIFMQELFGSFTFPEVLVAMRWMLAIGLVALVIIVLFVRYVDTKDKTQALTRWLTVWLALLTGGFLLWLTLAEINLAIAEAIADGESLPVWSNIIFISAGTALITFALWLWNRSVHDHSGNRIVLRSLVVVAAVVGGIFLIRELPIAFSGVDDDMFNGFSVTVMYSLFSVPIQLALGMVLAVMLFQNIRFKSFFRMVYFLPYITPFVATSVVFSLIFSQQQGSPANQLVNWLGIEKLNWLREPKGIFELMFGAGVPDILAGPSLALVVIIIFSVWTYAGYSAVIFLAGLGSIPPDVYEAARIDGANNWQQFRHITIPLLSPTTFFLILIATIGTFQAFTQIFLMRRAGAYAAVDTVNIYIYNEITARTSPDYAYGSAMAFVLFGVILTLTLIQNRVMGRKVFYG